MAGIIEQCNILADKAIDSIFDTDNIMSFLSVCASCWHYDYFNQLLIWKQNPSATDVCGINAWKGRGREVLAGQKPIVVLCPEFMLVRPGIPKTDRDGSVLVETRTGVELWESEPLWRTEPKAVPVFDVSQTEGVDVAREEHYISIVDGVIRGNLGISVIDTDASDLPAYQTYIFHEDKNELYIKKGLVEKEREHEALKFLVNKRLLDYSKDVPEQVNALTVFSLHILEQMLQMQSKNIVRGIAKRLQSASKEEKKAFLRNLSSFVKRLATDIYGIRLDFVETAAVNHLLDTDVREDIPIHMEVICRSLRDDNPDVASAVTELYKNKLGMASNGSVERLYADKWNMSVFSYPPYPLENED